MDDSVSDFAARIRDLVRGRLYLLIGEVTVRGSANEFVSYTRPTKLFVVFDPMTGKTHGALDGSMFRYVDNDDKWANKQISGIVSD